MTAHTVFPSEAENLAASIDTGMLFGVSFQETHQNDKVIRRSIFQKCPGIIIFHWATSPFGSLLTQLTQEIENSPEVHCILLQL